MTTGVSFEDHFAASELARNAVKVSFEDHLDDVDFDTQFLGGASLRGVDVVDPDADEVEEYDFPTGVVTLGGPKMPAEVQPAPSQPQEGKIQVDPGDGVTQVFPLSVPEVKIPERVGALYDELIDGHSTMYPPSVHEFSGPESAKLLERLLPGEFVHKIKRISERYERGHMYRRIKEAGSREKKSNHPHYYYLDKTLPGVTRVYFVDPEHKIADRTRKENALYKRVSVANIVAIEVPDDDTESPTVAVLRYRIPLENEDPRFIESGNASHKVQLEAAQEMLDSRGLPLSILTGDMHKEIKYSIVAREGYSRVQAVQSNNSQMRLFVRGKTGSRALEHKVTMQLKVLNTVIEMLSDPDHEDIRIVS